MRPLALHCLSIITNKNKQKMKKALLIGAALFGAVSFAGAQSLSSVQVKANLAQQTSREEATLQICGQLPQNANIVGVSKKAVLFGAARFDMEDLEQYVGWSIKAIDFFPGEENCMYNAMVWDMDQKVLAESGDFAPTMGIINQLSLTTPLPIAAETGYYIGYRADTEAGHPLGCEAGPAISGYGDLIAQANENGDMGAFQSLVSIAPSLNFNIYIVAHLTSETGVETVLTNDPVKVYVQNDVINVTGANGRQVFLYNMNGQLVYSGVNTTIPAQKGMYVLRVGARSYKLAI